MDNNITNQNASHSLENALEVVRPAKKSNNLELKTSDSSNENLPSENVTPFIPVAVDQLQVWKDWLSRYDGQLLAAMLQRVPTPSTRSITFGEFVTLFGFNFEPTDEKIIEQMDKTFASFSEWVIKFGFSYMKLALTASKINSGGQKFDIAFTQVMEKLDTPSPVSDDFKRLFI